MKINTVSLAGFIFLGACATVPAGAPSPATPASAQPAPDQASTAHPESQPVAQPDKVVETTAGKRWSFAYVADTATYMLEQRAVIIAQADSSPAGGRREERREIPSVVRNVVVAVLPPGEVRVINPMPQSMIVCDSVSAVVTRAAHLMPRLPSELPAGFTWSDSSTTDGCHGRIPATTIVANSYTVVGDTTFSGRTALLIHRSSTMTAKGEGIEGQHRVVMTASAAGNASLLFDVTAGHFLGMTGTQTSNVSVATSGRVRRFVQQVTERAVRTP